MIGAENTAKDDELEAQDTEAAETAAEDDVLDAADMEMDADLGDRMAELEAEIADLKEQLQYKELRAAAEIENMRRRTERDKSDARKFAISSFAQKLLTVADNMGLALMAVSPEDRDSSPLVKNLMIGVEATEREMLKVMGEMGIEKLEPMGEVFDPNFHEVMFEKEEADKEAGTVVEIMQAGYTLNGRLLRPARVGVAKAPAEGGSVDETV
ncbi:MAG: nucleotide exchange factor GrpE [Alphaproteobacteria bacterium]